jgi:lipopolysaccharide export LptBFGC system permease protein LptF
LERLKVPLSCKRKMATIREANKHKMTNIFVSSFVSSDELSVITTQSGHSNNCKSTSQELDNGTSEVKEYNWTLNDK